MRLGSKPFGSAPFGPAGGDGSVRAEPAAAVERGPETAGYGRTGAACGDPFAASALARPDRCPLAHAASTVHSDPENGLGKQARVPLRSLPVREG